MMNVLPCMYLDNTISAAVVKLNAIKIKPYKQSRFEYNGYIDQKGNL